MDISENSLTIEVTFVGPLYFITRFILHICLPCGNESKLGSALVLGM